MSGITLPDWFPFPTWLVTIALIWAAIDCLVYAVKQFRENVRHPAESGWKQALDWFGFGSSVVAGVVAFTLWVAIHATT